MEDRLTTIACNRFECSRRKNNRQINYELKYIDLPIFFNQIVACRRR